MIIKSETFSQVFLMIHISTNNKKYNAPNKVRHDHGSFLRVVNKSCTRVTTAQKINKDLCQVIIMTLTNENTDVILALYSKNIDLVFVKPCFLCPQEVYQYNADVLISLVCSFLKIHLLSSLHAANILY